MVVDSYVARYMLQQGVVCAETQACRSTAVETPVYINTSSDRSSLYSMFPMFGVPHVWCSPCSVFPMFSVPHARRSPPVFHSFGAPRQSSVALELPAFCAHVLC